MDYTLNPTHTHTHSTWTHTQGTPPVMDRGTLSPLSSLFSLLSPSSTVAGEPSMAPPAIGSPADVAARAPAQLRAPLELEETDDHGRALPSPSPPRRRSPRPCPFAAKPSNAPLPSIYDER